MGKTKIDIGKAIEMRVNGATLREIAAHFGVSPEGVRQALKNAHKKNREQKKLKRLLIAASIDEQGKTKAPADITKTYK